MKHDIHEFNMLGMTWGQRFVRVSLLIICIITCILNLLFWKG